MATSKGDKTANTFENLTRIPFQSMGLQERNPQLSSLFSSTEHPTATCKIWTSKPLLALLHRKVVIQQLYSDPDLVQPSPKPFHPRQQLASSLPGQRNACQLPTTTGSHLWAPPSPPAPCPRGRGSQAALPFVAGCGNSLATRPPLPPRPPHTARVTPSPSKGKWPPDHRSWAGWRKPQVRGATAARG